MKRELKSRADKISARKVVRLRADSGRPGHEWKDVATSCDSGKCRDIEFARRRIHRAGSRHACLRLRRAWAFVESRRHRFPRRIHPRAPGKSDRMRFLITAGPTQEPIDPVRYFSNRSSGKMGYAIGEAAIAARHQVTLISGPVHLNPPRGARVVSVVTSDEMFDAVHQHLRDCDILVMCAAVADYKPATVAARKIKKR